jgi:hypothetical protein
MPATAIRFPALQRHGAVAPLAGDRIPWAALGAPLSAAEDALARLDERLRASPVREGWIARTHFGEACAALWGEGALVPIEDLVLHDAGMDIRAPTHELIRAHAYLRARRRILAEPAVWALSDTGLAALRGDALAPDETGEGRGRLSDRVDPSDDDGLNEDRYGADREEDTLLAAELATIEAAIARSQRALAGEPTPRDPLVYQDDWDEAQRLQDWRAGLDQTRALPPLLAAALSWEAWQSLAPLQHRAWLGALLVGAALRAADKTKAHLLCLNVGLRRVARERRRAHDSTTRLIAFLEAVRAGAEIGMHDHDRLALARRMLERKAEGRRRNSHAGALIELVLARPIANAAMIAKELDVTARAAQNLVGALELREVTGRGRYRAWGIV